MSNVHFTIGVILHLTILVSASLAQTYVIEPDDYADGTTVSDINSRVHLSTALSDNVPVPLFFVSANDDGFNYAPTGVNVFGNANVEFWWAERRLRMDFAVPASSVSLSFAGGSPFDTEIGRLEAYSAGGALLGRYLTSPRGPGQAEVMTITRPQADIAWALAYVALDEGDFGRLDRLVFTIGSAAGRPGDLNCDGMVNNFDVDPFVLAISSAQLYAAAYPNCPISNADVNNDGGVNNFDVDAFVVLLGG